MQPPQKPTVLIVGGGFGGLHAAKALRRSHASVILLDRQNHHLFQPLLYQVATAALSPGNIASPLRKILERQANCSVYLGEVEAIDPAARLARLRSGTALAYDHLVLAAGVRTNYFGHEAWSGHAPGLKTIDDAIDIRRRYLLAFERAELEPDAEARRSILTFAIVGGGPTGVEMAGAMAELARKTMRKSFRTLDVDNTRIVLIDGNEHVLSGFPDRLRERAERDLDALGVELQLGRRVVEVREDGVTLEDHAGTRSRIETPNVIWAAGVKGVPLAATLGVELDGMGRVRVEPDLSIPGHPEAFVVGDLARVEDPATGEPAPGVAQGAIQMGRHAGRTIARELEARRLGRAAPERSGFRYVNKGEMATIGRARAVAHVGGRAFAGLPAWLLWAVIHILYLIGFRNRLMTFLEWVWLYFFYDRGVRLITGRDAGGADPETPVQPPGRVGSSGPAA